MVQQVIQRQACNRHAQTAHVGEIRQAKSAGFMNLPEHHLLLFSVNCPPRANTTLQRPAHSRDRSGWRRNISS